MWGAQETEKMWTCRFCSQLFDMNLILWKPKTYNNMITREQIERRVHKGNEVCLFRESGPYTLPIASQAFQQFQD